MIFTLFQQNNMNFFVRLAAHFYSKTYFDVSKEDLKMKKLNIIATTRSGAERIDGGLIVIKQENCKFY